MERRASDVELAVLKEAFKRHEDGCNERQQQILEQLGVIAGGQAQHTLDIASYKTTMKLLVAIGGAAIGVAVFLLEYFKDPILHWLAQ